MTFCWAMSAVKLVDIYVFQKQSIPKLSPQTKFTLAFSMKNIHK